MQKKVEKGKSRLDRRQDLWRSRVVGLCTVFVLFGCTTDPVPDEEFEAPTGNFPLLGNVPDRPSFPLLEDTTRQHKRLQREHDQATEKQSAIIKSIKP
ncbi:MAG: hypothetical protein K0R76_657 [Alphaproteobacteria bacterium]|jgi:hypothetical protein|nr:hypothetical protein [Alphaproteobacteria bacterium]MDF3033703.1 hypothetical protein [Alphaproteobacteria bacterium]